MNPTRFHLRHSDSHQTRRVRPRRCRMRHLAATLAVAAVSVAGTPSVAGAMETVTRDGEGAMIVDGGVTDTCEHIQTPIDSTTRVDPSTACGPLPIPDRPPSTQG